MFPGLRCAMLTATFCLALSGCGPRRLSPEREKPILSEALGIPVARLSYAGEAPDSYAPGAREWSIRDSQAGRGAVGGVYTQFSQVQEYAAITGDLVQRCPFHDAPHPLTAEAAAGAALAISRRLWPKASASLTEKSITVRAARSSGSSGVQGPLGFWVWVAFPRSRADWPRSASMMFDATTGVCFGVFADIGPPRPTGLGLQPPLRP